MATGAGSVAVAVAATCVLALVSLLLLLLLLLGGGSAMFKAPSSICSQAKQRAREGAAGRMLSRHSFFLVAALSITHTHTTHTHTHTLCPELATKKEAGTGAQHREPATHVHIRERLMHGHRTAAEGLIHTSSSSSSSSSSSRAVDIHVQRSRSSRERLI